MNVTLRRSKKKVRLLLSETQASENTTKKSGTFKFQSRIFKGSKHPWVSTHALSAAYLEYINYHNLCQMWTELTSQVNQVTHQQCVQLMIPTPLPKRSTSHIIFLLNEVKSVLKERRPKLYGQLLVFLARGSFTTCKISVTQQVYFLRCYAVAHYTYLDSSLKAFSAT